MQFPGHLGYQRGTILAGVTIVAGLLTVPAAAPAQQPGSAAAPPATTAGQPTKAEREVWRKALLATPRPKSGCFTANYPERAWREVPCAPSTPHRLYPPQVGGMTRRDIVGGNGPDFSATVTGNIISSEGSFDSVSGVTSANPYSLQLNTAPFQTTACNGSPGGMGGGCQGWQQFVYESSGSAFIQYWLLAYGPAGTKCPMPLHTGCVVNTSYSDGWCPFQFSPTGPVYCVINAAGQPNVSSHPMTALGQLKVQGSSPGGGMNDGIVVTESGVPQTANGDNRFSDLGSKWNEAEFNVFGNGNSSQATFNSGATLQVRTEVLSGSQAGPGCHLKSWTGESNNLTLVNSSPVSPSPTSAPALVFAESNPAPSGAAADCTDAVSLAPEPSQPLSCFVFDDGYTNMAGPSDAVFINGSQQACIPGQTTATCRKWFGRCTTNSTHEGVDFSIFDDGYVNLAGPSDAIFINVSEQACIPGQTSATCRKWFGRGSASNHRSAFCFVFADGYTNQSLPSDAVFINSGKQACVPSRTAQATCQKWWGRCQVR